MGHIEIFRDYPDQVRGGTRTLRIYTPDAYRRNPQARFPVLYMQDGQNVFAHPESARFETWGANTVLDKLVEEGRLEPWIIVAIDHAVDRFGDYSPWDFPKAKVKAHADRYARFLIDQLKPDIDRRYRTRTQPEWTAVMGSSLGGLISLYLGWRHGDVFGRIGGVSPTVMWSDGQLTAHWTRHTGHWSRIYLDAGAEERLYIDGIDLNYGQGARDFYAHLRHIGYADHEVCLVLEPGGRHSETDWQRRLPFAFRWLLC